MASLRDIDIALLRAFTAVAETGRMMTAARVVNLSQGAVSQQIKRLESLFGVSLFVRAADAARLTREGEQLIGIARRLIALNDEAIAQMRKAEFTDAVRLGVPHDIVGKLMPPILRTFARQHPNVLVTLVSETTLSLLKKLRDRKIDLAITTDSERAGRDQHLLSDRLVWVGAKGGEAWRARPLAVALGQEGDAFRDHAIRALTRASIDWRQICQVGSLEPVFATLEADIAVAPFLAKTVPDRIQALPRGRLPLLPCFYINLRLPPGESTQVSIKLASHIRHSFSSRSD